MANFIRPGVALFDDLLTLEVVSALSAHASAASYEDQDLGRGVLARRQRAMTDDPSIPVLLWAQLGPVLPPVGDFFEGGPGTPRLDPPVTRWSATGCNPRTRFYRYRLGASFSEHEDEAWRPSPTKRSLLTVLVYLPGKSSCVGGETVVEGLVIEPVDGRVVVFDHGLLHESRPVERGEKLTLRTDVVAEPTS